MSSPVSSCRRLILSEQGLKGSMLGGIVGSPVLPAVPDHIRPGPREDAGGVRMVLAAGDGVVIQLGGPGVGAAGVGGEVADRVARLFVDRPAEADAFVLTALAGGGRDAGQAGQRRRVGGAGAAVADLGRQPVSSLFGARGSSALSTVGTSRRAAGPRGTHRGPRGRASRAVARRHLGCISGLSTADNRTVRQ